MRGHWDTLAVTVFSTAAVLFSAPAQPSSISHYVAADVVKLRKDPRSDGRVLHNLRIGTALAAVRGARAPAGWIKVALAEHPRIQGFAAGDFLSREKPTVARLKALALEAYQAGDMTTARRWAERLVALDSSVTGHVHMLGRVYTKINHQPGIDWARNQYWGANAKYLGYCLEVAPGKRRAVLLARFIPDHGLVPLFGARARNPKGVKSLRLELQRMPWYRGGAGGAKRLPEPAALFARTVPGAGTKRPGRAELFGDRTCGPAGQIYSNEPLQPAKRGGDTKWNALPMMMRGLMQGAHGPIMADKGRRVFGVESMLRCNTTRSVTVEYDTGERFRPPRGPSHYFIFGIFNGSTGAFEHPLGADNALENADLGVRIGWFAWTRGNDCAAVVEYLRVRAGRVTERRIRVLVADADRPGKTVRIHHFDTLVDANPRLAARD